MSLALNVLIVEDNERMRKMIHGVIRGNIKNVDSIVECNNGYEAIGKATSTLVIREALS